MNFRTRRRREPQVIIVSLIDVVLQLVIFLLLTTTFKAGGAIIDVGLPVVESGLRTSHDHIILELNRDGRVVLDGNEVPRKDLDAALRRETEGLVSPGVVIVADQKALHGDVVALMDLARRNDIRRLAVAARTRGDESEILQGPGYRRR